MSSILEVKDLSKNFGSHQAVNQLNLNISPGECLALLGPNGAGKTTTVEMLEGLQTPTSGTIKIFGMELKQNRDTILEKIGVLLQETYLYKKLTVRETLALFASFFKHSLPVEEVITQMQLNDKADVRLEHLSGGQRQRVYVGCGLINEPKLLFLDEPTTGLDPQARRSIWEMLKAIKRSQRSILLTTHYMDEAEALADRVAIIDKGTIIAQGSPKQLIKDTCGEQALLVTFKEDNPQKLLQIKDQITWFRDSVQSGSTYEINITHTANQVGELLRCAESLNYGIDQLHIRNSTLEDVFLKLTGRSIRDE